MIRARTNFTELTDGTAKLNASNRILRPSGYPCSAGFPVPPGITLPKERRMFS
jgi:hypothetical protein